MIDHREQIQAIFQENQNFLLIPHQRPDPDALGASTALFRFLEKSLSKNVTILSPSEISKSLYEIPLTEKIIIFDEENESEFDIHFQKADVVILIDHNAPSRSKPLTDKIENYSGTKIVIDHHQKPADWADFFFHDTTAASTCTLIYRLLDFLNATDQIDKEMASSIYTGIVGDTGLFKYANTGTESHEIATEMIKKGIDYEGIHRKIFDSFTESRLRFIGFCISEKLVIKREYKTAYFWITLGEQKQFNLQTGDTEGLVNYARMLEGINLAVLIKEAEDGVRMSFRSNGTFHVNQLAGNFGGGGHLNAAGASSDLPIKETIEKLHKLLEENKEKLNY